MKIAIIGGAGKVGRWFSRFLKNEGFEVLVSGRSRAKLLEAQKELGVEVAENNAAAVRKSDAVLISVPIDALEDVLREIAPYARPEHIIFDVTSIKVLPVKLMHEHLRYSLVLGMHPVFGPGAVSPAGHNFILTPVTAREESLAAKTKAYLEGKGANVSIMPPEEHDRLMSVVLGLSHFIAIIAADVLVSLDNFSQLKKAGGVTYKALLTLVESVISEDPNLYAALQMSLPDMPEIHQIFLGCGRVWQGLVKEKNQNEFVMRMSQLRAELERSDPDFGKAYQNLYRLTGEDR